MSRLETQNNDTLNTDLITIDENGRLLLVGNNVFESIEQIGYIVDEDIYKCSWTQVGPPPDSELLFTGVKSFDTGFATLVDMDLSQYLNDGEVAYISTSPEVDGYFGRIGDKYYILSVENKYFLATGNIQTSTEHTTYVPSVELEETRKVYKPFFTEEQYEALIDLIS